MRFTHAFVSVAYSQCFLEGDAEIIVLQFSGLDPVDLGSVLHFEVGSVG
jgi:hypothetical protein